MQSALEYLRAGAKITYTKNDLSSAKEKYEEIINLITTVPCEQGESYLYSHLGQAHYDLARVLNELDRDTEAQHYFEMAISTWTDLLSIDSDNAYPKLAECYLYYGNSLGRTDEDRAEQFYLKALDIFKNKLKKTASFTSRHLPGFFYPLAFIIWRRTKKVKRLNT